MDRVFPIRRKRRSKTLWGHGRPPREPWEPTGRIRRRFRLADYGGFLVLFALAFAAGYHFPPFAGVTSVLVGRAPPAAFRGSAHFAICGAGPRVNCVIDGDTFYLGGEKIRIADIDTPELFSPQCAAEKALAARAQRRLHQLLNAGPIELRRGGRDQDVYGRSLRTVYRDGRSLGTQLVGEGLAHQWRGYKLSWCA